MSGSERETESLAFTRFNAEFQLQECRKTTKREWGRERRRVSMRRSAGGGVAMNEVAIKNTLQCTRQANYLHTHTARVCVCVCNVYVCTLYIHMNLLTFCLCIWLLKMAANMAANTKGSATDRETHTPTHTQKHTHKHTHKHSLTHMHRHNSSI